MLFKVFLISSAERFARFLVNTVQQADDSFTMLLKVRSLIDVHLMGAGYYAKIEVREAAGALFDPQTIPQPEQIRDRYMEITDLGAAAPYENTSAVIRKVFKLVKPKG